MAAPLDDLQQLLVRDHPVEQLLELGAGNLDALATESARRAPRRRA